MDNVKLLKRHLKDFKYISYPDGEYVDFTWVPGTPVEIPFTAAPFPIGEKELRLFPQGALSFNDIKIYTYEDLGDVVDKDIKRVSNDETFRLINAKPYTEIADLKVYILKRIEGES